MNQCPVGTWNAASGSINASACLPCVPGRYCSSNGLSSSYANTVTGPCTAGYYCPAGSSSSQQNICPTGHYCPAGSAAPIQCGAGTYQTSTGQSSCVASPPGYYTQGYNPTQALIADCPAGLCPITNATLYIAVAYCVCRILLPFGHIISLSIPMSQWNLQQPK